jgi:hypothetical protein
MDYKVCSAPKGQEMAILLELKIDNDVTVPTDEISNVLSGVKMLPLQAIATDCKGLISVMSQFLYFYI